MPAKFEQVQPSIVVDKMRKTRGGASVGSEGSVKGKKRIISDDSEESDEGISFVELDPDVQDRVMNALITEHNKRGRSTSKEDFETTVKGAITSLRKGQISVVMSSGDDEKPVLQKVDFCSEGLKDSVDELALHLASRYRPGSIPGKKSNIKRIPLPLLVPNGVTTFVISDSEASLLDEPDFELCKSLLCPKIGIMEAPDRASNEFLAVCTEPSKGSTESRCPKETPFNDLEASIYDSLEMEIGEEAARRAIIRRRGKLRAPSDTSESKTKEE